jgi:hypothetical protein
MDEDFNCPVCDKSFRTTKARNTHLSTAANCSWYRHGKFKATYDTAAQHRDGFHIYDLGQNSAQQANYIQPAINDFSPEDAVRQMEEDAHLGDYEDFFHFVGGVERLPNPGIGEPGPGPSTAAQKQASHRLLEDEDDMRVEIVHPTAGQVIRMKETLHEVWRERFGTIDGEGDVVMSDGSKNENLYAPFASELDWKIANWMVKENPGHGAFDRLLEIPGVCHPLSFMKLC